MGGKTSMPIDESVGFIESLRPDILQQLRADNPKYADILVSGVIGGEKKISIAESEFRLELSIKGLEMAIEQINSIIPKYQSRIKQLKTYEKWSQYFVAIGSSTVLATLISENTGNRFGIVLVYFGSILALLSSLFNISLRLNTGSSSFSKRSISDVYEEMIDILIKAEGSLGNLKAYLRFIAENEEKISTDMVTANQLLNRMNKLIKTDLL